MIPVMTTKIELTQTLHPLKNRLKKTRTNSCLMEAARIVFSQTLMTVVTLFSRDLNKTVKENAFLVITK